MASAGKELLCRVGVVILLSFQAFAYSVKLNLSLGPRVVLEPWLLQRGYLLYEDIADVHMPLMPLVLGAVAPLCSDGVGCARAVLVTLISLSALLTYVAGRRALGGWGGLGAALFFVMWSPAFGFGKLWYETLLTPLYLLLLIGSDSSAPDRSGRRLLLLGLVGGIAMLVKQQAAAVVGAFVVWNAFATWRAHRSGAAIARGAALTLGGAILPLLGFLGYQFARAGTLEGFWYWTISFNLFSDYRSLGAQAPTGTQMALIAPACLLLPAAIFQLVDLARKGDEAYLPLGWGLILLGASSLTVYPRFELFHLQPALPLLAWVSALTVARASRGFVIGCAAAIALLWLQTGADRYQTEWQADQPRRIREYSPLVPVAAETRRQIGPADCVQIFPDDEATANLYYLLRCPPPKPWVFSYPWFMLDPVKERILLALQDDPPRWIVHPAGRWEIERHAPEVIRYIEEHYRRRAALLWAEGEMWLLERR